MRALIAVTSGEPAGIGPELCLRLTERTTGDAQLVVLADRDLLAERAHAVGFAGRLRQWDDLAKTQGLATPALAHYLDIARTLVPKAD